MAEVSTAYSKYVRFWLDEIDLYERKMEKWHKRGKKIYKRYKDVRSAREEAVTRFNVLWSNVQTRLPALYARDPKPEVERRFKDRDPIGRQVAEILERSLDYTIQHVNPFGRIIRQCVLDYELPGRGTCWVRYVPHFHKVDLEPEQQAATTSGPTDSAPEGRGSSAQVREEGEEVTDQAADPVEDEELGYEETVLDYVYWEDYGHTWARTEDEIRAKWRRIYLTRDELKDRFDLSKAELDDIPLEWSPRNLNDGKIDAKQKKAIVYEIWDKQERECCWIIKNCPKELDRKDDPLKLEGFFPCPPPLYANLAPDELIPTPNFIYYADQASEIDELSTRITAIGKALKVCGIYDSSAPGLDRLLAEGVENQLIPIDGWMALKEKGGIEGVMQLLPLKDIAEALGNLREQRQSMIDDVYQITGLSDIIRGLSEPEETATAQQIKGQFAVLRISDAQSEVQRFCRDILRICAEIIAGYDIETLKKISGVKLLTAAEKQQLQVLLAQAAHPPMPPMPPGGGGHLPNGSPQPPMPGAAPGQAPPQAQPPAGPGAQPPPGAPGAVQPGGGVPGIDPEKVRLLKEPTWEEVAALLENPVLREFRIGVETDSTIRTDEESDRAARMDFIEAVGKMITEASSVPHSMIPAAGELILFGIRGFKVARNLERVFEDAIDQLKDQPPAPNPEMIKAQMDQQTAAKVAQIKAQTDIQIAQGQQQAQAKEDQLRTQFEAQRSQQDLASKAQHEQQLEEIKNQFESQKTQYETQSAEKIAQADNDTKLQIAAMQQQHEKQMKSAELDHEARITGMTQDHEKAMAVHQTASTEKVEGLKADKAEKLEGVKGKEARDTEKVKGENAKEVTKLKPEAEAKAKTKEEAEKSAPTVEAITKLTEALKEARKPRKIVRDKDGRISELH